MAVKKCILRYLTADNVVLRCSGFHDKSRHLMSDLYIHRDPDKERQVQIYSDDPSAWWAGDLVKGKRR